MGRAGKTTLRRSDLTQDLEKGERKEGAMEYLLEKLSMEGEQPVRRPWVWIPLGSCG